MIPCASILRWEKHDGETQRYYEAYLECDLWGSLFVVRRWGGVGSARGSRQRDLVMHRQEGEQALKTINQIRLKRGYHVKRNH